MGQSARMDRTPKTGWELLEPHIPEASSGGSPRQVDMRKILNAIFYILKSGIQ